MYNVLPILTISPQHNSISREHVLSHLFTIETLINRLFDCENLKNCLPVKRNVWIQFRRIQHNNFISCFGLKGLTTLINCIKSLSKYILKVLTNVYVPPLICKGGSGGVGVGLRYRCSKRHYCKMFP